ncbi:Flp family type IVb pilin [Limimaricola pyoseonensis]|uniref:Flp pilus assembly protein, pilin Flp n=1 Tax=Limimaricola pyoseonensis TaxID=521013 RepID=A0A1G7DBF6_9RHOB|nr:hypothetical protein [Limimaricola pyoseonensis]SDE48944.1 hypothetical protein SAMN04488567_1867 [Limimaricola pyoseonensis]
MKCHFARLKNCEDGAVSVDWVVLAAGIVAVSLAIGIAVSQSTLRANGQIAQKLEQYADQTPQ